MYNIKDDDIYASINRAAPSSVAEQLHVVELLKVCRHDLSVMLFTSYGSSLTIFLPLEQILIVNVPLYLFLAC
jgi:hypothetical protein